MSNFQTYPLSSSTEDHRNLIIDDKQSFPRLTSNDSGISFGDSDNESILFDEYELDIDQIILSPLNEQQTISITKDAQLASGISDEEKKFFCDNTAWAWHGEFGRLIMATAMTYQLDYRLILCEACSICPDEFNAQYPMIKSENAKAQFKCHICTHSWTSMRARCSFYMLQTDEGGLVLLKLYTQQCQECYSIVYPLWYYDEICRVMKNLAFTLFGHFLPQSFQWDLTHNGMKPVRRLFQRKGYMRGQHSSSLCEACQIGCCYE